MGGDVLPDAAQGEYDLGIPAEAVRLVVEVTSPSNRSTDTVTKLDLYARAGIEDYWVVDPEEVVVHVLDGATGTYCVATPRRDRPDGRAVPGRRPME